MKKGSEKSKLMKKVLILLLTVFVGCVTKQKPKQNIIEVQADFKTLESLKTNLLKITKTDKPRNYENVDVLNDIASYIKMELQKVCDTTSYQNFVVEGNTYKNVIGSIGIEHKERIIIGAHYDVCGDSDGADDNASGVAGLLELAKKLTKEKLKYRIDFVAYSLEEPPFFRTEQMGSFIHAKYLHDENIAIKGMICLESIGYFSEAPNSQTFPIPALSQKYGTKGDFITVVQNANAKDFSEEVNRLMLTNPLLRTENFKGVSDVTGVDYSDHLNYWKFNYDAVMITNTAFFRNKNYHTKGDVLETLDLEKMSLVIEQLYQTIKKIQ